MEVDLQTFVSDNSGKSIKSLIGKNVLVRSGGFPEKNQITNAERKRAEEGFLFVLTVGVNSLKQILFPKTGESSFDGKEKASRYLIENDVESFQIDSGVMVEV